MTDILESMRITAVALGFFLLTGCGATTPYVPPVSSIPPAPTEGEIQQVRGADYGMAPTEELARGAILNGVLNQLRQTMVDPDSTQIRSIQVGDFDRCVLATVVSISNSDRSLYSKSRPGAFTGYCVTFDWNSKNRMGGYGGPQKSVAIVHIGTSGAIEIMIPSADTGAQFRSSPNEYPYTEQTGVHMLSSWR